MRRLLAPVVLILFNRPQLTKKVFDAIADARPRELYLIADGPRDKHPEDRQLCKTARSVVEEVSWDCQVYKNYSERNLGCRYRIYTGLNWVFDHVDEAIILEDDCLPDNSFFSFCSELLAQYRNDARVMSISGDNFYPKYPSNSDSYYFSRYPHCWGWATWKRAWKYCDIEMNCWPTAVEQKLLHHILDSYMATRYWHYKFQQTYLGEIDTWDYPWTLSCWLQGGLSILPRCNLVSNIGFSNSGTHHRNAYNPLASLPTEEMEFPLTHPNCVLRNRRADNCTQRNMFGVFARALRKVRASFLQALTFNK